MSETFRRLLDVIHIIIICTAVCIGTNFILLSFQPNLLLLCNLKYISNNIKRDFFNCKTNEKSLYLPDKLFTYFHDSFSSEPKFSKKEIDWEIQGKT